jgi:demethylmenaquinone methyltransferase/2-methoxy-6-polyprenyl-1,4-benzoquinol methylase
MNLTSSETRVTGAAPLSAPAKDEREAAAAVQQMFSAIAPRYDLLNHVLSMNVDRLWWRRTARTFALVLQTPGAKVLDLCCGTGDMTFALAKVRGEAGVEITGVDFSAAMLGRARAKSAAMQNPPRWVEADALNLPLPDSSLDLVVSAFGFRNLANYDRGLGEIARVLKPGGQVGILDFAQPGGAIGKLYAFYFRRILPRVGTFISGVRGPYEYLPASVERFPSPSEMLARMAQAGFARPSWTPYTFGIAGLFRATRR